MATLEKLNEPNKVRITFEFSKEDFASAIEKAYQKNKAEFNVSGFRKGKVPKQIVLQHYGEEVLYEDAVDFCLDTVLDKYIEENDLFVVSRPEIDIEKVSMAEGATILVDLYLKPTVTVEDYIGIEYTKVPVSVSDEEVQQSIDKELDKNARFVPVEDRPIEDKDIVTLNFEGFIDGVPFEGGKADDYELVIGSKSFIDDFEEQLIGASVGDDVEVRVSFPGDYGAEDLQGKPASFNVTINEIKFKEKPELDDDFAQDVSEFDTLIEYRDSVKETLSKDKEASAKRSKELEVLKKLGEKVETEIPESMIITQTNNLIRNMANNLKQSGLELEQYLQFIGKTVAEFQAESRESSIQNIKENLALEAIAIKEDLQVSDEEMEKEIKDVAEVYGADIEDIRKSLTDFDRKQINEDILIRKALDFILEKATEVE